MNILTAVFFIIVSIPEIDIAWKDKGEKVAFAIKPQGGQESARDCAENGLQYRFRVDLKWCIKRPG